MRWQRCKGALHRRHRCREPGGFSKRTSLATRERYHDPSPPPKTRRPHSHRHSHRNPRRQSASPRSHSRRPIQRPRRHRRLRHSRDLREFLRARAILPDQHLFSSGKYDGQEPIVQDHIPNAFTKNTHSSAVFSMVLFSAVPAPCPALVSMRISTGGPSLDWHS